MILGKGSAIGLPKAMKKLSIKPTSSNIWEKLGLQSPPPTTDLSSHDEYRGVRKGFFAVYVGKEAKRYVIPLSCLKHPVFLQLLKRAEEEFGFSHSGGLRIPCDTGVFDHLLLCISREHNGSQGGEMEDSLHLCM